MRVISSNGFWAAILGLFFLFGLPALVAAQRPSDADIAKRLRVMGPGLWVFDRNIDRPGEIVRFAKATGMGHILPLADGRGGTRQQILALADEAKRQGLVVVPWIYATARNQRERINMLSQLAHHPAVAGVMLNIEHPRREKSLAELEILLRDFNRRFPRVLVGYTGYNLAGTHSYVGIDKILPVVDYWTPQVYWNHNGSSPEGFLRRGEKQWEALLNRINRPEMAIVPAGNVYWSDVTIRRRLTKESSIELSQFSELVFRYPALSWYLYDEVSLRGWATEAMTAANKLHPSSVDRETQSWMVSVPIPLLLLLVVFAIIGVIEVARKALSR